MTLSEDEEEEKETEKRVKRMGQGVEGERKGRCED
jgi:hypothetical protein